MYVAGWGDMWRWGVETEEGGGGAKIVIILTAVKIRIVSVRTVSGFLNGDVCETLKGGRAFPRA